MEEIINLYNDINSLNILSDKIISEYDYVIVENKKWIEVSNYKWKIVEMWDKLFSFWNWLLSRNDSKNLKILLILNKFNVYYYINLLNNFDWIIHIVNLWVWASWITKKHQIENMDISLLTNFSINVYEPYDKTSLLKFLMKKENIYVRISDKEYVENLFNTENNNISEWVIGLYEYWYSWDSWTIVFWWSMLKEFIQILNSSQENSQYFDAFILNKYNFEINDDFLDSIRKNEKLTFVIDWSVWGYKNYIKAKLREKGIIDIKFSIITPNFDKLNCHLYEYNFENAEFDSQAIYEKILENI